MDVAILIPSPVPYTVGGIENLAEGLKKAIERYTPHSATLINIPVDESTLLRTLKGYNDFKRLNLSHFDVVISLKYPAWNIKHKAHIVYMCHRLRGVYDTYQGGTDFLTYLNSRINEPGSIWERLIVHKLDNRALSTKRVAYFFAISKTVRNRLEYFPEGANVRVLYPPPKLDNFYEGKREHFLAVGRLDAPKRFDLIIEAYKRFQGDIPLYIVGEGAQYDYLKTLALSDNRIKFLGQVKDDILIELYANSIAVLYAPYLEDYGYVTIEAFKSKKPVITCRDSGGVLEFVEDNINGFVVNPEVVELSNAILKLFNNPELISIFGERGFEKVKNINWEFTVKELLRPFEWMEIDFWKKHKRKNVLVLGTFPLNPCISGGRYRVLKLLRGLSNYYNIIHLSPLPYNQWYNSIKINDNFIEIQLPQSFNQSKLLWDIEQKVKMAVNDIMFPETIKYSPNLIYCMEKLLGSADIVILSHPYWAPAVTKKINKDKTKLIYLSADVEYYLKQRSLPLNYWGIRLKRKVYKIERNAVNFSDMIITASKYDSKVMANLYERNDKNFIIAPNSIDFKSIRFLEEDDKSVYREKLGLPASKLVLFLASWHPPNLDAMEFILNKLVHQLPNFNFVIAGTVIDNWKAHKGELPIYKNAKYLGILTEEEKNALLNIVDIAINPINYGSGTNVKVLEFMAYGLPVVNTPFGNRGINARDGKEIIIAERDNFAFKIKELFEKKELYVKIRQHAYKFVFENFNVEKICENLFKKIEENIKTRLPFSISMEEEDYLIGGFYALEKWADGKKVRWMKPRAQIILGNPKRESEILIYLLPPPVPHKIKFFINERLIEVFEGEHKWQIVKMPLPAIFGVDYIKVEIETTPWCPDEVMGTGDRRILGSALEKIEIKFNDE